MLTGYGSPRSCTKSSTITTNSRDFTLPAAGPLTIDEVYDHFKRTLAGSKWKVMRGWHILRHSFASNCAANGIDQRLLDS